MNHVDKQVSDLTNWLIIGPFQGGIDVVHEPEQEFRFGYMYKGLHGPVTWTIPKIEVLGEMIDPEVWGTINGITIMEVLPGLCSNLVN